MHLQQPQQQKEDERFMNNHREGRNGHMKTKHKVLKKKLPKQKTKAKGRVVRETESMCNGSVVV